MRYLILGDVHGNWEFMSQHIFNSVRGRKIAFDAIIQVGDFGYYETSMRNILRYVDKIGVPIHFIDGNHERHDFLNATHRDFHKHGLFYHPRGDITILSDGTKIGWMGGAFNVDRPQEFWMDGSQNFPTKQEISAFIDSVNAMDGVDLLVTHSCPHSLGIGIQGHPGFLPYINEFVVKLGYKTGPLWDCGDEPLLDLWRGLTVKPSEYIFGHFHQHHHAVIGATHIRCVGACDNRFGESRIYIYDSILKKVLE